MNWRKWKVGFAIAIFCGLLTAGAGAAAGMTWQAFAAVLCTGLLTHLLTFLKQHPVENIEDTRFIKREGKTGGSGPVVGLAFLCVTFLAFTPGCAVLNGDMNEGDVALLAQDLRDVAQAGTVYALSENPEWRANIMVVRDQLSAAVEGEDVLTFDSILSKLQGLPVKELKSNEALLAITAARITLRRAGRNVELGNIANVKPLAQGLAQGMTEGLATVPAPL